MFKTPIRIVTILALCSIGLLTPSGVIGAQDAPATASGFDGVWVMSTTRSSIVRMFTERTRISHNGQTETFESEIGGEGNSSGIRYTAPTDGRPAPFYDRVSGKKRGTVTVTIISPSMTHIALVEDDPKRGSRWLEHWLSQDGRTYISLLKDQAGVVKSVLVFEKQPR
jgi:hypothetical protein